MEIKLGKMGLPVLEQFSEEGFIDCTFAIQELREEPKHYHFHMAASFANEVVGVDVRVIKEVQAGFDANMELNQKHVYREGVKLFRSGPESDKLLCAIASLYTLKTASDRMRGSESFTAIALHQGEIDLKSQGVKFKIFGNDRPSDDESDYYESFFNLDLSNGFVFWNEKDQEYRAPLVRSLSAAVV